MGVSTGVSTMRVLVTGGTTGLGQAMAGALATAGAAVALTGRSAARAAAAAAELPGAIGIELDVRDQLLDPAVMGPPVLWLASDEAAGVHDERIVATEFEHWLRNRAAR